MQFHGIFAREYLKFSEGESDYISCGILLRELLLQKEETRSCSSKLQIEFLIKEKALYRIY